MNPQTKNTPQDLDKIRDNVETHLNQWGVQAKIGDEFYEHLVNDLTHDIKLYLDSIVESVRKEGALAHQATLKASGNQVDTLCVVCGRPDPVWFAPNRLFNTVMGSGDGIICPVCFIDRAESKGIVPTAWLLRPEAPPIIEREWSMPNKWTFTIKPIANLLAEEVGSGLLVNGLWCDPFAGEASPAQVTNDIHPDRKATHHMDALEFLKSQPSNHFDGVLYDPPYSFRQAKECYDEANIEPPKGYTSMGYWSDIRNELARATKSGGKALCFGWNTMGLGKKRGFVMTRVLLVPHGGNRNDTIVTVEVKS